MDVVRADPESELDRILELQRDARHLVAADALEELEARLDGSAAAARCRARLSTSPAVARARELATQLRAARDAFRDGRDDGWIFGHRLDGVGGSTPLDPWDAAAVRRARDTTGAWVHLDFRAPQAQEFIAGCARTRGKWLSALLVEDPRILSRGVKWHPTGLACC